MCLRCEGIASVSINKSAEVVRLRQRIREALATATGGGMSIADVAKYIQGKYRVDGFNLAVGHEMKKMCRGTDASLIEVERMFMLKAPQGPQDDDENEEGAESAAELRELILGYVAGNVEGVTARDIIKFLTEHYAEKYPVSQVRIALKILAEGKGRKLLKGDKYKLLAGGSMVVAEASNVAVGDVAAGHAADASDGRVPVDVARDVARSPWQRVAAMVAEAYQLLCEAERPSTQEDEKAMHKIAGEVVELVLTLNNNGCDIIRLAADDDDRG